MKPLIAFLSGVIFSCGLLISQMTDPGKVLAFVTLNRHWDPSLIFVMGAGVFVMWGANWLRRSQITKPLMDKEFHIPSGRLIDRNLVLGAVMFGAGWGLIGLCPAPAIAALATFKWQVWLFFAAMCSGIVLQRGLVAKDLIGFSK